MPFSNWICWIDRIYTQTPQFNVDCSNFPNSNKPSCGDCEAFNVHVGLNHFEVELFFSISMPRPLSWSNFSLITSSNRWSICHIHLECDSRRHIINSSIGQSPMIDMNTIQYIWDCSNELALMKRELWTDTLFHMQMRFWWEIGININMFIATHTIRHVHPYKKKLGQNIQKIKKRKHR